MVTWENGSSHSGSRGLLKETALARARAAAAKHRSDAARQRAKITPRTSDSMVRMYQRAAEAAEKRATTEDGKVSTLSTKLGRLTRDLATAEAGLEPEVKATARRNESVQKAAARRTEQEDARRRLAEQRHAQEIARIAQPTVRYVHEVPTLPPPKPEVLRVLYLTANPEMDLRMEGRAGGRLPDRPQPAAPAPRPPGLAGPPPPGMGRPTKRDRRQLDRTRGRRA